MISDYEKGIKDMEENSWMISGDSIAKYRTRTAVIPPKASNFITGMDAEGGYSAYYELSSAYVSGQMSAQELLSSLDKKVSMMRLEGN